MSHRRYLLVGVLFFALARCAFALDLGTIAGGPAGPAGPPGPAGSGGAVTGALTPNLKNNSAGTVQNKLVRWTCAAQDIHNCTARTTLTTDLIVTGVCDSTCSSTTTDTPVLATQGVHAVIFDGLTTVGDCAIISTTVAGDAHDTGAACTAANLSSPTTNLVGTIQSVNGGAGTAADVSLAIGDHQIPLYTSGKCQVGSDILLGTCSGVGCPTGANGTNGWTNLCTVTLGPWLFDPGVSNTTCYIAQNIIDFTFAPNAGAGGAGSSASATNLEFRLATSGGANADNHGFPIGAGTNYNTTQQRYTNQSMVGLLNFASTDPMYPSVLTLEIDGQTAGPTNSEVQINHAALDGNHIPNGTASLVICSPFLS